MPRIPVTAGPGVASRALQAPSAQTRDPVDSGLTRGLLQFGEGMGNLGQQALAEAKQAREKANAVSQAEADTAYERGETGALVGSTGGDGQQTPGFYSTRGKVASEKSRETLDGLESLRQDIAKKTFADEEQRRKWLSRSGGMFEASRRKVETHAARQFEVAEDDALKGRLSSGLDAVATGVSSEDVGLVGRRGEEAIRALQRSKEGGDAAVQSWWAQVSRTHIGALLEAGDVDGARAAYNGAKDALGTDGSRVNEQIKQAEKGRDREAKQAADETAAAQIVREARGDADYLDADAANAAVDKLEPGRRDELRPLVEHRIALDARRKASDIKGWENDAFSARLDGKPIPGAVYEKLKQYDADFLARLKKEDRDEYRRAVRESKGDRADAAAARREQALLNKGAWQTYMSLPLAERVGINVDTEFLGSGADKIGLGAMRMQQTKDRAALEKGEAVGESAFVTNAKSAGAGLVAPKGMDAKEFEAEAHLAYSDFFEKNKRKPNEKESKELITDVLLNQTSRPGALNRLTGGLIPTTVEVPGYKARAADRKAAAKAPPAERTMKFDEGLDLTGPSITSYAYSPDKRQRRARYSDGTLGPPEMVP